jgi:hypothetical protein
MERADVLAHRAEPMSTRVTRAIGWAGLSSFLLIMVAAFVVAPPLWAGPGTQASAEQVADYVHAQSGRTIASLLVYSLALGLFLVFAMGLGLWLRQGERAPHWLSTTFLGGSVALTVLILAGFVAAGVMSYRLQTPAVAQALRDLTFGLLALSGVPTAVCLGAYAWLVMPGGSLPRWTMCPALLGVAAHLLLVASFVGHGSLLSLEGSVIVLVPGTFFAWILAASVALLGRRSPIPVG